MIISNGKLQVKRKSVTVIDPQTGFPVPPAEVAWSEAVPVQIVPVQLNALARSAAGDSFVMQQYQLYIDGLSFEGSQIRVTSDAAGDLGEFSVISVEPLRAVNQTRINI